MFGFAFGGNQGAQQGGGFPFFGGQPLGAQQRPTKFNRTLRCFPYIMHPSGNQEHNENGDKIFLPATALEELVRQNSRFKINNNLNTTDAKIYRVLTFSSSLLSFFLINLITIAICYFLVSTYLLSSPEKINTTHHSYSRFSGSSIPNVVSTSKQPNSKRNTLRCS